MSFMSIRPLLVGLPISVALSIGGLGCSSTPTQEPIANKVGTAGAITAVTTQAPVARNAHGRVKVIGEALSTVPLTNDQRARLEGMAAEADARHAPVRSAYMDLANAVADQVQAGSINRGALQPKVDAYVAAVRQAQPGDRAAFEQMHALLGPQQRGTFVDSLEQTYAFEHTRVNRGEPRMKRMANEMGLTEQQKDEIKSAMTAKGEGQRSEWKEQREERKAEQKRVLEAFRGDHFVLDEIAPAQDPGIRAEKMTDKMLSMGEAAVPVLTPAQRSYAAQKIRERGATSPEAIPPLP